MFTSLTKRMRAKAGWFIALLYLFCVIAPGVALALGDAADCLPTSVTAMHDHSAHDHAHAKGAMHTAADAGEPKHQHHGKNAPGPCCAMLCLSAIAADLPLIAKPEQPKAVGVAENYQRLADKAPPRHYRPPIA